MRLGVAGLAGLLLLAAATVPGLSQPAPAPSPPTPAAGQSLAPKRVIVLPPMQWDWTMTDGHPLGHQGRAIWPR